jgi:RNA polymerase sigma factor (sigma-70 family)
MGATSIASGARSATALPVRLSLFGDDRLARLVANGNERAFATIYDRYHRQLYRYCRSIVRHDADAQDVLQSALTSALRALQRGQCDAPLRPWLFRIVHNEAISLIRRRRTDSELDAVREVCVGSAEDRAGERERLALLVADLQELPDRQRAALVMRELNGLTHEEIGIALQTSVGAAKQAIFEARRALLEFEEGRSMVCEEVRRTVSDGDGRALRGRRVRAHVRDCAACDAFATAIPARRDQLRMVVPPLAPAASAAVLARILGAESGRGAAAGAGAGIAGTGAAGKTVGATLAAKALTGAAVLVTAAAGVVGIRSVVPSSPHSPHHSMSAHGTVIGTAAHVPTHGGQPTPPPIISVPSSKSAISAGHSAPGPPTSAGGSSAATSASRAFTRGRSAQRASPAGGLGNATVPPAARHAHASPGPSSSMGNSAQRPTSARVPPAPSERPAPRVGAPPSLG